MKKFRGIPKSPELEEAEAVLGSAPEVEFTFLLIPMNTYAIALEAARKENCSVVEVFQRSLLQYLQSVFNEDAQQDASSHGHSIRVPEPTFVMRPRRPKI